ncbi:MAG TPA: AAA family ATPase [Thermoanaerobaculia bacterium]|jgi:MoxR-like ATPase|nr:AAA family ATPase [Thermoanaerobaculia bacterium]
MSYEYMKIFEAPQTTLRRGNDRSRRDRRDGAVYIWTPELELAVNIALATERPLLVRGPSGTGKSSLAASLAVAKGWRYYEEVVSSTTEARHFLWRFDTLRRLSDAQAEKTEVKDPVHYVEPGVLWWSFDPESAARRGVAPGMVTPLADPNRFPQQQDARAVVLIDEIDKADPDVPNNLLVPLGSLEFTVTDAANAPVTAKVPPVVIITTNDERELPGAFTRRCVVAKLEAPDEGMLLRIARAHFGDDSTDLYAAVYEKMEAVAAAKKKSGLPLPSTAEFLDAIGTCLDLKVTPGDHSTWQAIERAVFVKPAVQDDARP